jgi:hypothetical protein
MINTLLPIALESHMKSPWVMRPKGGGSLFSLCFMNVFQNAVLCRKFFNGKMLRIALHTPDNRFAGVYNIDWFRLRGECACLVSFPQFNRL